MSEDLKPLRDKLNHLHDHLPEGEYKAEVVTILQELNRIEGVTGDEAEAPKANKTKIVKGL